MESMHTESVKKIQEFQVVKVLFARKRGDHPHIVRSLTELPSNWRHSRRFENSRKKQESTGLRLSDVIWFCERGRVDSIPDIPIFEFIWERACLLIL